jgi:hypothetical protein
MLSLINRSEICRALEEDPMNPNQELESDGIVGSLDGLGAADHDQPYRFGRRPRASAPYPFSTRQYARLLLLRGRVRDQSVLVPFDLQPAA